jgi:hypothetical protein
VDHHRKLNRTEGLLDVDQFHKPNEWVPGKSLRLTPLAEPVTEVQHQQAMDELSYWYRTFIHLPPLLFTLLPAFVSLTMYDL